MFQMNFGAFDLNLLVVFDAVMQERSVTRAGGRIGLSQPAMSHALNRLRHLLKDPLFVRTPEGMVPTPRAEQLAEPLRRALSDMQAALEPELFAPDRAERRFAIAVNNYAAVVVTPTLVLAAAEAAPKVGLDLRPSGLQSPIELLDRGELDLALGYFDAPGERFATASLLEDHFVLAMRADHPAARSKLTAKSFAALQHLEISSSGEETGFIDAWLAREKMSRHVAYQAPYLSAGRILQRSNMVTSVSASYAQGLLGAGALSFLALPCPSPRLTLAMLWHRRLDNQPAQRWLRGLVSQVCQGL